MRKRWKSRSSSKKKSVAEREGKKNSIPGHGHLDTTYGECVVTAI